MKVYIPVDVFDDAIVGPDKTLVITLIARSQNGALVYDLAKTPDKPFSATINIFNDDIAPSVWIESIQNGAEGGENGFFRFRRDNSQNQLTVNYAIAGTAKNGTDYTNIPVYVTFPAGQDYVDIPIVITDDTMFEPDETVIITLLPTKISGIDQYLLADSEEKPASGTLIITDNDAAPHVRIESIQDAREAGQNGIFRLRRDSTTNEVTVKYSIHEDSTAVRNKGFTIAGFTGTSQIYGLAIFAAGQEYVDIVVNPVDDDLFDGDKILTIELRQGNENTYLLGDVSVGTLTIFDNDDPSTRPTASDDLFFFEPQNNGNGLIVSGNVLHNDLDIGGSPLDVSFHSVVLIDTIGFDDFRLNEDGTFDYAVNSIAAGGSFTYKIVAYDGKESNVATARFAMNNTMSDAEIIAPLDEEEVPQVIVDEAGCLQIMDNVGNVIGVGAAGFDFGEGSVFVPPVIGTYTIIHTATTTTETENPEDEEECLTEEATVMIVSAAYDNGDWTYTETVRWHYADTTSSERYWGGYEYVFTAWSTNGTTGYTYDFRSRDDYDVTTRTNETTSDSSTMFQSREVGYASNSHFRGFWNEVGMGIDYSRTESSLEYRGNGRYSYEVEGGNVSGTMKESADSFDFSDTFVNFAFDLDTEVWIALSGVYSSVSRGKSDSNFEGKGNYEIEDYFTETDSFGESSIRGEIKEKGASNSSYLYEMFGLLAAGEWSIDGTGESFSEDMSEYENSEKGKYSVQKSTDEYESETEGKDENRYLDRFSVNRQTAWTVIGGTWTAVDGREEESGLTESYSWAKSENNVTIYDDYEPIETRIETEAKSEKKDEYSLTRTLSNNSWNASEGDAESYVYGYYCEDVETKEGTYRREMYGGMIEGDFGALETEMNEFEYTSSSVIGSDGRWRMDEGTGYYRYKSENGNYSKGKGEYTVEGNGWSFTGEITESWKLSGGSGGRTEYVVENGTWAVNSEMHTNTSWYRTEETDNAEGTWQYNNTIGDYSREVTNKFSDDREIGYKYKDGDDQPEQDGTIKIESNKKYAEYFDGIRTGDISSSLTIKEYSFETSYQEDISLVFSWQSDDDEEHFWTITSGTHFIDHSYVSENTSDSYRTYYTPSDNSTTEINECQTSYYEYRDTTTEKLDVDEANQFDFSEGVIRSASDFESSTNPLKDFWEIESGKKERRETVTYDSNSISTITYVYNPDSDFLDVWNVTSMMGSDIKSRRISSKSLLEFISEYDAHEGRWIETGEAWTEEDDEYRHIIDNYIKFGFVETSAKGNSGAGYIFENRDFSMVKNSKHIYEYIDGIGFILKSGEIVALSDRFSDKIATYREGSLVNYEIIIVDKHNYTKIDDVYKTRLDYNGTDWIHTVIEGDGPHLLGINTYPLLNHNGKYRFAIPGVQNLSSAPGGLSSRAEPQGGLADPEAADMPELPRGPDNSNDNNNGFPPEEDPSGGQWSVPEDTKRTGNNDGAVQAIKNALEPALRARCDQEINTTVTPHGGTFITTKDKTQQCVAEIEISDNTATISLYITTWETTHLNGIHQGDSKPVKTFIGKFTMEVSNDGLPSESVLNSAKYLITLMRANPPGADTQIPHITENMSQLAVRQEFKRATGMTAIEDMFLELPQAETRQKIKDLIDKYLDSLHLTNTKEGEIDFTWFYSLSGMDKTYEKIMTVLSDRRLSFLKSETISDFYVADALYFPGMRKIVYKEKCDGVTFMHELWHAYNALYLGNKLSERSDEGVAYSFFLYTQVATKIYNTFNYTQLGITNNDTEKIEQAVEEWNNKLMKYFHYNPHGDDYYSDNTNKTGLIALYRGTSIILSDGKDYDFTKEDFVRIKNMLGLDFSKDFLIQITDILNTQFSDWEEIEFFYPRNMFY